MKPAATLASGLLALAAGVACRPAESPPPAPAIEEIPVTTSSAEARAHFERGRELMDVGRYQEAHERFEAAAAEDPSFAYAYVNLADTAKSWRKLDDYRRLALAHLEGKSAGERLLAEILETLFDNDAERRFELARELAEAYPRSPRAWLTLAGTQTDLNLHQAARESIKRALELDPDWKAAHVAAWGSYLFHEPKDFAAAERAMLRCLELDPQEAKLHENLGDVYRAMQQLDKAAELYARAAELDPGHAVAHVKRGHVYSFLGDFDRARAAYDLGVEGAEPQERISYANYRAFTHLHAGDPRAALDELADLASSSDAPEVPADQAAGARIFTLGNQLAIALHHGFLDDAESILAELAAAVRENVETVGAPDFARHQEANLLLWQSRLAARRGDYEGARARAEEHRELLASDHNPRRFEGYHGLLGLIELLRGDHAAAARELRKSDASDTYVKYHLALAEAGAGNAEEARRLFQEVAEWNFNSVDFALVRNDALARAAPPAD